MSKLLKKLSMEEYYLKQVYSRGGKYTKGHPISDRLVLCPLHDDKNPSMGFIHGKDGITKFHCFGCGKAGDIIDLHMGITKTFDRAKALKEVCEILGIPFEEIEEDGKISQDLFNERLKRVRVLNSTLTQAGFSRIIRENRNKPKEVLSKILLNALWLLGEEEE